MDHRKICKDKHCLNHPDNHGMVFDPNGVITICDKCYFEEVSDSSVDELMEIHSVIAHCLDNARTIEDILALPFSTEDIIDELMADDDVRRVADSIKDKWTDRFNQLLRYKMRKDYG